MSEDKPSTQIVLEDGSYETRLTRKFGLRKAYAKHDPRVVRAAIPGSIVEVSTAEGKDVKRGDVLMILDAMKMNNRIQAPHDGRIKMLCVAAGDKVVKGQLLLEMDLETGAN